MPNIRELILALRELDLDGSRPALVHASLSAFGNMQGGANAVVSALKQHFETVVMPTFTYRTMVIPEYGPPNNAIHYGSGGAINKMAEVYHNDMTADPLMGIIPETLRQLPRASRSRHPILSFSGLNAAKYLKSQTREHPLAPIAALMEDNAWILLLGVGHTSNTSIHLGERLAGRKTFTRWALVPGKIVSCPGFPSCSDGFDALQPHLEPVMRVTQVGPAWIQAIPLSLVVRTVRHIVEEDPLALLCNVSGCPRCEAVRNSLGTSAEKG
jgi:aminoglycoside 3-N-acetyltransferase